VEALEDIGVPYQAKVLAEGHPPKAAFHFCPQQITQLQSVLVELETILEQTAAIACFLPLLQLVEALEYTQPAAVWQLEILEVRVLEDLTLEQALHLVLEQPIKATEVD
jgi:hypothetical protein